MIASLIAKRLLIRQKNNFYFPLMKLSYTRFTIRESHYQELLTSPGTDLQIFVSPNTGKHPRGHYVIPHEVALNFIQSKRDTPNWDKNRDFKQDGVPSELRDYFTDTEK